ncbi:MAG: hypothetical protein V7603_345 [Micromonosporaceae bacterium]
MVVALAVGLFAAVFARTLVAYLRRRDPVQRDVVIVFAAVAMLFVLSVVRAWVEHPPRLVTDVALAALFGQPFFTLRLVGRVRRLPGWLYPVAVAGWVGTVGALVVVRPPLPRPLVWAVVGVFCVGELTAAGYFGAQAVRRAGAARVRLAYAAAATALLGVSLLIAAAGPAGSRAARPVALVSAVGYLLAFTPPAWLRRRWSVQASAALTRQLLAAPFDEAPRTTWQRFAGAVRPLIGADAAVVLLPTSTGRVGVAAAAGVAASPSVVAGVDELDRLLAVRGTIDVQAKAPAVALAASVARQCGARFVTAVALPLPAGRGGLVLLNQHRSLFGDDDVLLFGEFGVQAGSLAERGAVLAERRELAAIVQSSHDAIMGKTLDGVITSWNAGAERLYGYRAAAVIGRHADLLVPPDQRAHEALTLRRIANGERVEQYDTERIRVDGSVVTVARTVSPITDPTGHIVGVASVSRDVSERQRAEVKFRGLLEAAPDAIVGVNRHGRIELVNAQAERLFGYARDELLGQPVEMLVPEYARGLHPGHRRRYSAQPQPRPMGAGMQLAGRRKDGSQFPAEISLSAIQTEDGVLVSAAIRDVSERTRAEVKVRGLLEAAPDAIVGVTPDGAITLVNAQAERLFGYHRDELLGQPIEILVPDRVRQQHPAHRSGYFAHPQPRPMGAGMQLAARRKDGTEFPAEISLSALDTEDGPVVSAAIRDVTERLEVQAERERLKTAAERERLEAQLHQSQRLESLGQLAGGVAHDFNNLLAVMLNYTTFIAEEITNAAAQDGERWRQVCHDIAQVQRAGERATELTHQLLAFGRREVVRPQVLNLNTVVAEIDTLLRRTLGEHIQLHTTLTPDLWPVLADPGQLEQVLVNLAVNARDAMSDGGTLSIDTTNLTIDGTTSAHPSLPAGRHVKLRVADTGTGMPPEIAERVFEPFFTTKPKGEGSGLGLATVYGIITQAGGHAQIRSSPGAGTAFTALLPATDRQPHSITQPTRRHRGHGGETILVVEDEPALREVTRRILTRNGYHVLTAGNGPEALKTAEHTTEQIHLLLTDVIMPHMLGKELATTIRDLRPNIRVLYMSGYAQPVLASQGTLDPGVTLVEKPFSEPTLLDKIRDTLDTP